MTSVADFLNISKLKETKASAGKFTYFDSAGEFLVQIQSSTFGFKEKPSGGRGPAFFALENKILTSTSDVSHLRVGRTVSVFAEDDGKQAQVYLPKIKNAVEAILNVTPEEIEKMSEEDFAAVVQGLFFDKLNAKGEVVTAAGAVGEILVVKAVDAKNKAREDRVYSAYHVAADDQLAAGGYQRNAKGVIVPLAQ
jgi:hypothetical protein